MSNSECPDFLFRCFLEELPAALPDIASMEYFARHPTLDMLELYILNQLHHEDQKQLANHLDSCRACQDMTGSLQEQIDLIREALPVY